MWTRKELKTRAKLGLSNDYWKAVLVAVLMMTASINAEGIASFIVGYIKGAVQANQIYSAYFGYGLWGLTGAITAIVIIVAAIFLAIKVVVYNPLLIGIRKFALGTVREGEKGLISDLGIGFDRAYKNNVKVMFMTDLMILLWSLPMIIFMAVCGGEQMMPDFVYVLLVIVLAIPACYKAYELRMVDYIILNNPELTYKEAWDQSKLMMNGNKWKAFLLDLSFLGWLILGGLTIGILVIFYVGPYIVLTQAALYDALSTQDAAFTQDTLPMQGEMPTQE